MSLVRIQKGCTHTGKCHRVRCSCLHELCMFKFGTDSTDISFTSRAPAFGRHHRNQTGLLAPRDCGCGAKPGMDAEAPIPRQSSPPLPRTLGDERNKQLTVLPLRTTPSFDSGPHGWLPTEEPAFGGCQADNHAPIASDQSNHQHQNQTKSTCCKSVARLHSRTLRQYWDKRNVSRPNDRDAMHRQ